MISTIVEQILGTTENEEVYPDYYLVGENKENFMVVHKDNGIISGFSIFKVKEKGEKTC